MSDFNKTTLDLTTTPTSVNELYNQAIQCSCLNSIEKPHKQILSFGCDAAGVFSSDIWSCLLGALPQALFLSISWFAFFLLQIMRLGTGIESAEKHKYRAPRVCSCKEDLNTFLSRHIFDMF